MKKIIWSLLLILCTYLVQAQVKVGDNINTIDAASILELESADKVFVITRVTGAEMSLISPLNGAMVYNTDAKCIFVYEGTIWKSLCNSEIMVITSSTPPLVAGVGDIWVNDTNGEVFVWDGSIWVPISRNPSSGNGAPNNTTNPNPVIGDIYVNQANGDIYTYDGTSWINQSITTTNGISETLNNTIELGGTLTKATEINTDTSNTLAITGLEEVTNTTNAIVTVEPSTGILKKTPVSAFLQQEEIVILASDAQTQFTPPLPVTTSKKLNVYRNGVRLGFTIIDSNTIQLEVPVVCYQNDEIRIVQFY